MKNCALRITLLPAVMVLLMAPAAAPALDGQDVVVVANSASKESMDLAKFYLQSRQVPESHFLAVKTTTDYEISRTDFETQIRQPLRDFLKKDELQKIRCIVVIWGMPGRVAAGRSPSTNPADDIIRTAVGRAHRRLATDLKLMENVGKTFPSSMPADLLPPEKQFDLPQVALKEPLDPIAKILKGIASESGSKQGEIRRMKPAEQALAHRQMMSLHADIYGLKGLANYVDDWHPERAPKAEDVRKLLEEAEGRLDKVRLGPVTAESVALKAALLERVGGLSLVTTLTTESQEPPQLPALAVDSDLSLLLWSDADRTKARTAIGGNLPEQSVPNALFWRNVAAAEKAKLPKALLVGRLDGATADDAKRVFVAALATEKTGLAGTFYIDAGVRSVGGKALPAYAEFDAHLKKLNDILTSKTSLKVVYDDKEAVFAEGTCPDAALYAGWYSLRNYVPAFKWTHGAVGIHYASWEAVDLRNPKSNQWCPRMIAAGVSGTAGAVREPYLHSFMLPEEFFPLLLTGKYTLGECFWRTSPMSNWQFELIGDPLYNPLAAKPAMKVTDLPKGLAP